MELSLIRGWLEKSEPDSWLLHGLLYSYTVSPIYKNSHHDNML